MTVRSSPWPHGVPNFVNLETPDLPGAVAFYTGLFGWDLEDQGEPAHYYHLARRDGHRVGGISPQLGETPTGWTVFVSCTDADQTAAAITAAGGRVLAGPFDVGPTGRQVVAADPAGAVFAVWQAGTTIGAELTGAPGALAWEDILTPDPAAAQAFYSAVFGWRFEKLELPAGADEAGDEDAGAGPEYWTFHGAGEEFPMGGLARLDDGSAPRWNVYVQVASPDETVATARDLGGTAEDPWTTPYGRMAWVTDPSGARLVVMAVPPGAPQPDRQD